MTATLPLTEALLAEYQARRARAPVLIRERPAARAAIEANLALFAAMVEYAHDHHRPADFPRWIAACRSAAEKLRAPLPATGPMAEADANLFRRARTLDRFADHCAALQTLNTRLRDAGQHKDAA